MSNYKRTTINFGTGLILMIGIMFVMFGLLFMAWSVEAKTFNKFKSADTPAATVWDAAFSELRVESR